MIKTKELIMRPFLKTNESNYNNLPILNQSTAGDSTEILDKMAQIFQAIGYFDMGNIVASKASSFVKGIFR